MKKIYKEISEIIALVDQMRLTNICKVFHPVAEKCPFFSKAHRTFSKIGHILGHKENLTKYKKLK
jgi:hypothetical protein